MIKNKNWLIAVWEKYIAWRFPYYKTSFAYRHYLRNYRQVLQLRGKTLPVKLEFRCGIIMTLSNAASSLHIFDEIFVSEDYKLPKSNREKTIVDIGANVGLFSIYALLKNPKAKIYSIEADPLVFREFSGNLNVNFLTESIRAFNLAMTSSVGKNTLYSAQHSGWSSIFNDLGAKNGQPVDVESVNLTRFCENFNIEKIDYLKIDIEGAEYDLILGDNTFFKNQIIKMTVELDKSPRDRRYNYEDLIKKMKKHYHSIRIVSKSEFYPLLYCSAPRRTGKPVG